MTTPAGPSGWFPDPNGQPGQRYYDGRKWTEHFAPHPPPPQPPVVINNIVGTPQPIVVSAGTNHALHLILTLLTCGMWLPVWIIVAIAGSGSRVHVPGQRSDAANILMVIGAVFGIMVLLGIVVEHPWLLVPILLLAAGGGAFFFIRKDRQKQEQHRQALASHAEYENQLWHQGDPRGTYGLYPPAEPMRKRPPPPQ